MPDTPVENSSRLFATGQSYLRTALDDPNASFRNGQWEAIETLVSDRSQLLVVQRTGWGKSAVYFIATRLLRDQGAGPTLLISPLLSLMRNQVIAAERLGIRAERIDSTNSETWRAIEADLLGNKIDVLLISPERLANDQFRTRVLDQIAGRIGMVVVDEAHCISDWGHDFRPDYRRIVRVLQAMPPNVPVLGTTATANDRVIRDVSEQLGKKLQVIRGNLARESLRLQNIFLPTQAERLAWLAARLADFAGSGIIYARTVRDTQQVAAWLQDQGVPASEYHGSMDNDKRIMLENALLNNQVKALVATSALGMGFDKPDLAFVIHISAARFGS